MKIDFELPVFNKPSLPPLLPKPLPEVAPIVEPVEEKKEIVLVAPNLPMEEKVEVISEPKTIIVRENLEQTISEEWSQQEIDWFSTNKFKHEKLRNVWLKNIAAESMMVLKLREEKIKIIYKMVSQKNILGSMSFPSFTDFTNKW